MARYLTLDDVPLSERKVLVRSDLNVPIENGVVGDDYRVRMALGTIERLRFAGAVTAVCSHLGRPQGPDPSYSLAPVAKRMEELGGFPVRFVDSLAGQEMERHIANASPGDVLVLENTRFEAGETENDPDLAERLAAPFDLFVEDAFGSVHRAHASTVGVAERLQSVAGEILVAELESLGVFLRAPERPYVVVLGGAKVSDKLGVIRNLLPEVDTMLIGGGMCFTLLAARGHDVANSMLQEDEIDEVRAILDGPQGDRIQIPDDIVAADSFAEDAPSRVVEATAIPEGTMGLDIGPDTAETFGEVIKGGQSVFWNGPMGVFEWERFRAGTEAVARAVVDCHGFTAVGGGDSVAALRMLGLEDGVSHVSTGGGAGLELLEGQELPGVAALERWAS